MNFIYCTNRCPGANTPFAHDHVILMDGLIDKNDSIKLENLIKKHMLERIKVICYINSGGGDFIEALEIGNIIKKYSFDTLLSTDEYDLYNIEDGKAIQYNIFNKKDLNNIFEKYMPDYINICYSAANFIFIAGKERHLYNYRIYSWGTHRLLNYGNKVLLSEIQEILYNLIIYLMDSKVSLDFLRMFLKQDDFISITENELIRYNIATKHNISEFNISKHNDKDSIEAIIKNWHTHARLIIMSQKDKTLIKIIYEEPIFYETTLDNNGTFTINNIEESASWKFERGKLVAYVEINTEKFKGMISFSKDIEFNLSDFPNSLAHLRMNYAVNKYDFYKFERLLKSIY